VKLKHGNTQNISIIFRYLNSGRLCHRVLFFWNTCWPTEEGWFTVLLQSVAGVAILCASLVGGHAIILASNIIVNPVRHHADLATVSSETSDNTSTTVPADTHRHDAGQCDGRSHCRRDDDDNDRRHRRRHNDDDAASRCLAIAERRRCADRGRHSGSSLGVRGKQGHVEVDRRRRSTKFWMMTSFSDLNMTSTASKLSSTDAAKSQFRVIDARCSVHTRRRSTVSGCWCRWRRLLDYVIGAVGPTFAVLTSAARCVTELAERTAVARRTTTRECIKAIHADAAVQTWCAQRLTVISIHVAANSGKAECADAPETIAFVNTPTCNCISTFNT